MIQIPKGMIIKTKYVGWSTEMGWYAIVGWPTPKGNFGVLYGKWTATGKTEDEAVYKALKNASPTPLTKAR